MPKIAGLLLLATSLFWSSSATAEQFRAGITRIKVAGETPFEVLVAYPTKVAEVGISEGSFEVRASDDAPIVTGAKFPILLFAKGNGREAGSPFVHHDLILRMAREGFVVVAPFYPATERPFISRPKQTRIALQATIADARFSGHVNSERIGMMGYSFGGAITLLMAGARLNFALLSSHCRSNSDDWRACDGIPIDGSLAGIPSRKSDDVVALKALVLFEPYGAPFGKDDLLAVGMPVLIYRALESDLKANGNALSLVQNLPNSPSLIAVSGGHGIFIAPCPASFAAFSNETAALCKDGPGVDRVAIHERVGDEIAKFLRAVL